MQNNRRRARCHPIRSTTPSPLLNAPVQHLQIYPRRDRDKLLCLEWDGIIGRGSDTPRRRVSGDGLDGIAGAQCENKHHDGSHFTKCSQSLRRFHLMSSGKGGPTRHAAHSETIDTESTRLHWIPSLLLSFCSAFC